jgi:hypothetical protein
VTTTETTYRPSLPRVPNRLRHLPILRGYPVPWFVCQQDDGSYDFRVADGRKLREALERHRCWICGGQLPTVKAFTIGPMCAVNRTTAEPPAHRGCAEWAAIACPFLNQQQSRRRRNDMPEGTSMPAGEMIERQTGATLVWVATSYELFDDGRGSVLIRMGEPMATQWYAHGRAATREEVLASFESGLPTLRELAEQESEAAVAELNTAVAKALRYVPTR